MPQFHYTLNLEKIQVIFMKIEYFYVVYKILYDFNTCFLQCFHWIKKTTRLSSLVINYIFVS